MYFQYGFQSSVLLIFFIHGLVYALLLFRKSYIRETEADLWLGTFLVLCVLNIAPWMLGFAGWYDNQPYRDILFYTPFLHLLFFGPVIFFYVQSLLNPGFTLRKKDLLHFIPGILYILYTLVIVVTDKLILHRYYFLENQEDPDFDRWYQAIGYISMIFYFMAALRYYTAYKKMVFQVTSYAESVSFIWIRNFLLAFLLIIVTRFIFFVSGLFFDLRYLETWWFYLAFALAFYYIAISGYANSVTAKLRFTQEIFSSAPAHLLQYSLNHDEVEEIEDVEVIDMEHVPATEDPLTEAESNWKQKITALLVDEKIYEEAELTLPEMAKMIGINTAALSRLINRLFKMNFNDMINFYRIQGFTEKIHSGEHKRKTLLSLAFDCGFNSKATFNRAFKKVTGQSPKDYLAQAGL